MRPYPVPVRDDPADSRQDLDGMLAALVRSGGSDLHLTAGAPPTMRVHGDLHSLPEHSPLRAEDTRVLCRAVLNAAQWAHFEVEQEVDVAFERPGVGRFRVSCFRQRGACAMAVRAVPHVAKPLRELGLPEQIERFAHLDRGLVLLTGPSGAGKTTTLTTLIDIANRTRRGHIVTVEDPIEFVHEHDRCVVNQRDVGVDTNGYAAAVRRVLRQDPDIVVVGELRDPETISAAISAANNGRLVFATMNARSAAETVDRLVDAFPPHRQHEIRVRLSRVLQGIVTQVLAKRADRAGRTAICEVLVATAEVRGLVREGRTRDIPSAMQSAQAEGMLTFDGHLARRVRDAVISPQQALELCEDPVQFQRLARPA